MPNYPALQTASVILKIIGWIVIVVAVLSGLLSLGAGGPFAVLGILGALFLLVNGVIVLAFGEIIHVFVDIANNTRALREIAIKSEKPKGNKEALGGSPEQPSSSGSEPIRTGDIEISEPPYGPNLPVLDGRTGPYRTHRGYTYFQYADGTVDARMPEGWQRFKDFFEFAKKTELGW